MDKWTFGLTMTIVGTGATFVIMGLLVLMIGLLKRVFPLPGPQDANQAAKGKESK